MRPLSLLAPLLAGALSAQSPALPAPSVIARHVDDLGRAIQVGVAAQPAARSVVLIVDVTPYTYRAAGQIAAALRSLDRAYSDAATRKSWRIAALGKPLGRSVARPGDLVKQLRSVFKAETQTENTFASLQKTLRGSTRSKAAILYLADWHIEDDYQLESFVARVRGRGQAFTTIGSEACFGRAWNDGFFPPHRTSGRLYDEGIGRNPFQNTEKTEPWHGGDTAWPHYPFYWHGAAWSTKFPVRLPPLPRNVRYGKPDLGGAAPGKAEDLRERMRKTDRTALEVYHFPVPSGFGPYGLMRLAAETGGKYILWSWNPGGRTDLAYDYSRINRNPPDLRSRRRILAEIRRRPLVQALLEAWRLIGSDAISTSRQTPAVDDENRARAIDEINSRGFTSCSWGTKEEWEQFLKQAPKTMAAQDRAIRSLERAIQKAGQPSDPVTRRYLADAELFYQTLLVHRFTMGEAYVEAKKVPAKTAWDRLPIHPTVTTETFIESHKNSAKHEVRARKVALHDAKLGAKVLAARRDYLERYAMTPHGEIVARNPVHTMRIYFNTYASGRPTKDSPAESNEKKPRPVTPRSKGRAGPKTGK